MFNIIKATKSFATANHQQLIRLASGTSAYKNILTEVKGAKNNVGFIQLNRPKALNALNAELMTELGGE